MLAPAAFLASAAFTLQLQNKILPAFIQDLEDVDKTEAFSSWTKLSQIEEPLELLRVIQKVWDGTVASAFLVDLLARADTPTDRARLFSACADHSGKKLVKCFTNHSSRLTTQ